MNGDDAERTKATLAGCLYASHGIYLVVAGLALAVLSWLIPMLLVKVLNSDVVEPDRVSPLARGVIEHRALVPLLAAPAVATGIVALLKVRPRWLWIGVGLVSLLLPAALLLYTFVATVGLLYQVEA